MVSIRQLQILMTHVLVIESAITKMRLITTGVSLELEDFEIKECNFGYLS